MLLHTPTYSHVAGFLACSELHSKIDLVFPDYFDTLLSELCEKYLSAQDYQSRCKKSRVFISELKLNYYSLFLFSCIIFKKLFNFVQQKLQTPFS